MFRDHVQLGIVKDTSAIIKRKRIDIKKSEGITSVIFSVNERTGLPSNDISVYMNKNTSPEVREFIKENLLADANPNNLAPSGDYVDQMSDDDKIAAAPLRHETLDHYERRIKEMADAEKQRIADEKFAKKFMNDLKERNAKN